MNIIWVMHGIGNHYEEFRIVYFFIKVVIFA